jgi:predicted nucleic acid-binding protein
VAVVVLDASVLIALLDPADALNRRAVGALAARAGDDLVLPASALAETLVKPAAQGRLASGRAAVDALLVRIEPLTDDIAEVAAQMRAKHRTLRLPDALVIATAEHLAADELVTADRRWRRLSPLVQLI